MPPPAPTSKSRRALTLGKTIAKFAAWWSALLWAFAHEGRINDYEGAVKDVIARVLAGFPSADRTVEILFGDCVEIALFTLAITLFLGTPLAILGAATRMIARARLRAGQADLLDRIRTWSAVHPRMMRALLAVPALGWMLALAWPGPFEAHHAPQYLAGVARAALPLLAAGWGVFTMTRKGLRELLAPTFDRAEAPAKLEIEPDEITFDAVAVTPRTVALVAVFAAITFAVPAFLWTRPILELFTQRSIFYFVGAYIAFAVLSALWFQKASRVAVGADGVLVKGTSRTQFFAYRDLDAARVAGADLELVRGAKVALRLQLHGDDAARRDAVLARIRTAIDRVKAGQSTVAAQLVSAATAEQLARAAGGSAEYRGAALTRAELWALVEGPEGDASARRAAAGALATTSDDVDRARLRVAAEQCADPGMRTALIELAAAELDEPRADVEGRAFAARR